MDSSILHDVLSLFLPEGTLNYFDISSYEYGKTHVIICLCEKKILPEDLLNERVHSNGYFPECTMQDFPIRGRKVFLKIRRRRWEYQDKRGCFSRNWDFVAQGTRISKEFAAFLKELPG